MIAGEPSSSARPGLARLVLSALVVGALTGLLGGCFRLVLLQADRSREFLVAWAHGIPTWGWLVPVVAAALATALARFLVRHFAPSAAGSGIPRVEAIVREGASPDPFAVLPVKFVGGLASMGAGLALGREGPTVQIGATIASAVARVFRLRAEDGRVLVAGGAAAGLATAFSAPLGGAVFILEEVMQRFEGRATIAVLGATGAATMVGQLLVGTGREFAVGHVEKPLSVGLLLYLSFGLVLGMLGALYNRLVLAARDLDARFARVPFEARAAAIGAAVGLLAWWEPQLVGGGETQTQQLLLHMPSLQAVLLLVAVRFLLGPISYASGTPGGLFAPILLVGAALGAAAGILAHTAVPWMVPDVETFVVVGMVAFFTATVRAPVTGIALVVEMTGVSSLFMPLLVGCCGAFVAANVLGSLPIYDALRSPAKEV